MWGASAVSGVAVDAEGLDAVGASHLATRFSRGVIRGYMAGAGAVMRRSHNEEQGNRSNHDIKAILTCRGPHGRRAHPGRGRSRDRERRRRA